MNYYIILITLIYGLSLLFSLLSLTRIIWLIGFILSKDVKVYKEITTIRIFLLTAFFWALYDYLILSQL